MGHNNCIPVNTADQAWLDSTHIVQSTMLLALSNRISYCWNGWPVGMGHPLVPTCCLQHPEHRSCCSREFSGWDVSFLGLCEVRLHRVDVSIRPVLLHVPPIRYYLLELVTQLLNMQMKNRHSTKMKTRETELGMKQEENLHMLKQPFPVCVRACTHVHDVWVHVFVCVCVCCCCTSSVTTLLKYTITIYEVKFILHV